MKNNRFITLITLCLLIGIVIGTVSAYMSDAERIAAGKVYVSDVTYDPAVFFTGDAGTVTLKVTNSNTDQGVVVNHASYSDENIKLKSGLDHTSSNIGPGKNQTFIFSVVADCPEGTFYPLFSLDFRDADSLWHKTMVQVDNTPLELTGLDTPDTFTHGKKDTIRATIANPRKNNVKNVIVEVSGSGVTITPSKIFIGALTSGASTPINFTITPDQPTTLLLTIKYNNGDNIHKVTMDLPVTFGTSKKQANPVVSNVQVKFDTGIYHITGDVTNAGLETANSVMVTSLSPAVPQDPYMNYVVGALKPDDFASFEVTFSADSGTSIPLQLSYKDTDGNVFISLQDVKISSVAPLSQKNGQLNLIPIIAGIVIVAAFVGGWFFYLRKKK
jgi:hypothetical protein